MAIKPILFNTEMVRAILDGRKTCTRRIVKGFIPDDALWGYTAFTPKGYISCRGLYADGYGEGFYKLPYQPEDILYVRETWHGYTKLVGKGGGCHLEERYGYKASIANSEDAEEPWKPSIHMPKEGYGCESGAVAEHYRRGSNQRRSRRRKVPPYKCRSIRMHRLYEYWMD